MRFIRGLFYGLLALAGIGLAAGLVLPKSAHVERSIATTASPATVYGLVSSFEHFNQWSPWFDLDPKAQYAYSGPASGVGAKMSWHSEDASVGSGSQEILAVEPERQVKIRLDFGGSSPSTSTMTIRPDGTGSRITWAFDSDFTGHYFDRYFGVLFEKFIGGDYEKGLAKLKALAESTPAAQ